jgi:hypothetical protein
MEVHNNNFVVGLHEIPEKYSCLTVCLKLDAYWGYTFGLGKDQEFSFH